MTYLTKFGLFFYLPVSIFVGAMFWEAWRKRSLLAFWIAIFFGCAAWFTGPLATEVQRIIGAAVALLFGGVFAARPGTPGRRVLSILGSTSTALAIFLTSERCNHLYFEEFVGYVVLFALASAFAGLCVGYVLPKLDQKRQAVPALLLSVIGAFGMVMTSFAWWMTAVSMNVYPENLVVRTVSELAGALEKATLEDRGVFLLGHLVTEEQQEFVAYFSVDDDAPPTFPQYLQVELEDGERIEAHGPTSVRQTFDWPPGGPRQRMYCLRPGDPVVVWGSPGRSKSMTDGKESYGLSRTRLVAFGSLEDFQSNFLLPGRDTARFFGWIGLTCMVLSFLVMIPGLVAFLFLREHGREDPTNSRVTWS